MPHTDLLEKGENQVLCFRGAQILAQSCRDLTVICRERWPSTFKGQRAVLTRGGASSVYDTSSGNLALSVTFLMSHHNHHDHLATRMQRADMALSGPWLNYLDGSNNLM